MFSFHLKILKWQSVRCNTAHHCYDFEYAIKSELSQFKFYCLVDGCLFSPQIDGNYYIQNLNQNKHCVLCCIQPIQCPSLNVLCSESLHQVIFLRPEIVYKKDWSFEWCDLLNHFSAFIFHFGVHLLSSTFWHSLDLNVKKKKMLIDFRKTQTVIWDLFFDGVKVERVT